MNIDTQKFRKQTIVGKYNIYKELISRYDKRLEEVNKILNKYICELNEFIEVHDSIIVDLYDRYARRFENSDSGKFYLDQYRVPDIDFVLQNLTVVSRTYFIGVEGLCRIRGAHVDFVLDNRFKYECTEILDLDRYEVDTEYASDIREEIDSSITRIQKLLDLLNNIYSVVVKKYNELEVAYNHVMLDIVQRDESKILIKLYNNLIELQNSNNSIYAWYLLQVAGEIYKDVGPKLGLKVQGDLTDFVKLNTRIDFIHQCYLKYAVGVDSIFEEDSDEDVEENTNDSDDIDFCY